MVPLVIQMITILPENLRQTIAVQVVALGQVNGHFK